MYTSPTSHPSHRARGCLGLGGRRPLGFKRMGCYSRQRSAHQTCWYFQLRPTYLYLLLIHLHAQITLGPWSASQKQCWCLLKSWGKEEEKTKKDWSLSSSQDQSLELQASFTCGRSSFMTSSDYPGLLLPVKKGILGCTTWKNAGIYCRLSRITLSRSPKTTEGAVARADAPASAAQFSQMNVTAVPGTRLKPKLPNKISSKNNFRSQLSRPHHLLHGPVLLKSCKRSAEVWISLWLHELCEQDRAAKETSGLAPSFWTPLQGWGWHPPLVYCLEKCFCSVSSSLFWILPVWTRAQPLTTKPTKANKGRLRDCSTCNLYWWYKNIMAIIKTTT